MSSDTAGLILATGIIAGAWLAVGVIFWRASEYLAQSVIPLSQVTALLGYSSQTSLNRACLRWFGQTPNALRRQGSRGSQ